MDWIPIPMFCKSVMYEFSNESGEVYSEYIAGYESMKAIETGHMMKARWFFVMFNDNFS